MTIWSGLLSSGLPSSDQDPVRGAGSSPGAGHRSAADAARRSDGRCARAAPPGPGDLRSVAWPLLRAKGGGVRWTGRSLLAVRGLAGRLRARSSAHIRRSPCQDSREASPVAACAHVIAPGPPGDGRAPRS